MATEKMYYQSMDQKSFTAAVLSCERGEKGWQVVLDRTLFYPEGGGQPADHGLLGEAHVVDVQEKEGVIYHTCDAPLEPGVILGVIDWDRRWDHTQQHSGEHIFSGILCHMFDCDNVGFHLGNDVVTVDYNTEITWEQAREAETKANGVIQANAVTRIDYPSEEELARLSYRSKKELSGSVRIVTFPNADCCACCGTHVHGAGEVLLVKVLSVQKCRGGTRMEILCGQRALKFLSMVFEQNRAVGQALSVKADGTAAAVARLQNELQEVKLRAAQLESELAFCLAEGYAGAGDVLIFRPAMQPASVRILADAIAKRCGGLAAVFAGEGETFHYALGRGDGQDISPLVKSMNAALNGRGGGRSGFAQGSVRADRAAIEKFWSRLDK